ncbi:MAG: HD-GYP domain-containing protein, partial [Pirellulaceae bacterium]|nr:HD-GYP domain-containing protein [Pirellulaceae bacterium]
LGGRIYNWFDQLVAENSPGARLLKIAPDQAIVAAISESEFGEPEIVGGPVSLDPWQLAQASANLAVGQAAQSENEEMLDHYATRLSASFEELCFLRRLSKHVDFCVADRPPSEVVLAILPEMRQLIEVEALCMMQATRDETTGQFRPRRITGIVGQLPIEEKLCCQVIDQLGNANRRVLVKNYCGELGRVEVERGDFVPEGLKSLVVAPVEKDGVLFGWLVGINKQANGPVTSSPLNSLGYDEIGSMEATLLEASALMLGSHANNHRLFQDLEQLIVGITHTLVGSIEARDAYTSGHSDRVAMMGRSLAAKLGLSREECQDIFLCGLLHDIGKIGIPDHILQKPGRLTDEEFAAIKTHPEIGARLLRGLRPLEKLLPGVLHHHESVDGTGYPHGLKGDEIPLMARILAVADAFDAMTSDRPYRNGMPLPKAESILREGQGTQWDTDVIDAFFAARVDMERICQHYKRSTSVEMVARVSNASTVPAPESPPTPSPVLPLDLLPLAEENVVTA